MSDNVKRTLSAAALETSTEVRRMVRVHVEKRRENEERKVRKGKRRKRRSL